MKCKLKPLEENGEGVIAIYYHLLFPFCYHFLFFFCCTPLLPIIKKKHNFHVDLYYLQVRWGMQCTSMFLMALWMMWFHTYPVERRRTVECSKEWLKNESSWDKNWQGESEREISFINLDVFLLYPSLSCLSVFPMIFTVIFMRHCVQLSHV